MKKNVLLISIVSLAFLSGYTLKGVTSESTKTEFKKVTGIGGIFFKCKNPAELRDWYSKNLGLHTNEYGAVFEWRQGANKKKKGFTQWSPFVQKTTYFGSPDQQFMINYRVENLVWLVDELKKNGVKIVDSLESYSYGKFIHIEDLEGNRIELWEPNDLEYEKMGKEIGAKTNM